MVFGISTDIVNGKVSTGMLFFLVQPDADGFAQKTIDHKTADQGKDNGQEAAGKLGNEGYATHAAQGLLAEDARVYASPFAGNTMLRPEPQHIVDPQLFLFYMEAINKNNRGHATCYERGQGMHEIASRSDGDQSGQGTVMNK